VLVGLMRLWVHSLCWVAVYLRKVEVDRKWWWFMAWHLTVSVALVTCQWCNEELSNYFIYISWLNVDLTLVFIENVSAGKFSLFNLKFKRSWKLVPLVLQMLKRTNKWIMKNIYFSELLWNFDLSELFLVAFSNTNIRLLKKIIFSV
jgi:hypothetical protein